MRHSDIQRLREAGLISEEQRARIVDHFGLKEEGGRFLAIISMIGAALVAAGIILLISSNWEAIPKAGKIACGILLMLGAHAGGWQLREVRGKYRKTGEALHLVGSAMFLGNIALIGQILHLSSRPPNALLLWFAGIAAMPWILRSLAQHILALLAFGAWFGMEINESGSLIYFGGNEYQILLYALLGLIYLGLGYCLRRTRFAGFAAPTELLGLCAFQLFAYPMTWGIWGGGRDRALETSAWIFPGMAAVALATVAAGLPGLSGLTRQWRWTWGLTLAGGMALLAGQLYFAPLSNWDYRWSEAGYHWIAAFGLSVFCLLQIQVGAQERSAPMINLGVAFFALEVISAYFRLIGSMARTGLLFVVSGVFLIAFGVYLEKKRRAIVMRIKAPAN